MDREKILERGLAIVESDGADALSIRGLARDLQVSAPALYEYIRSREDLLRLLAQRGYDELALQRQSIEGPPVDWLVQTGQAYVTFAVEHPQLFSLMHRFGPGALIGDPGAEHPAATILFDEGVEQVNSAITAGDLAEGDPFELAVALWAAAHGVATVAIMTPALVDHRALTDRVLGSLLQAWRPNE